jgi:hypothetical protein
MGPICLAFCTHHEQVAVAKGKSVLPAIPVASHVKIARSSKTKADHMGVGAEFGFAVAVPAHVVPAVAVEVGQDGVGWDPEFAVKTVAKGFELRRPALTLKGPMGLGVPNAGVALKERTSGFGNLAAKHANASLGPVAAGFERGAQRVGF